MVSPSIGQYQKIKIHFLPTWTSMYFYENNTIFQQFIERIATNLLIPGSFKIKITIWD